MHIETIGNEILYNEDGKDSLSKSNLFVIREEVKKLQENHYPEDVSFD